MNERSFISQIRIMCCLSVIPLLTQIAISQQKLATSHQSI